MLHAMKNRRVVVDGGFKSTSINESTVESHDVDMNRGAYHGCASIARHEEHRRVVVDGGSRLSTNVPWSLTMSI